MYTEEIQGPFPPSSYCISMSDSYMNVYACFTAREKLNWRGKSNLSLRNFIELDMIYAVRESIIAGHRHNDIILVPDWVPLFRCQIGSQVFRYPDWGSVIGIFFIPAPD
jgi:hypothetical protein